MYARTSHSSKAITISVSFQSIGSLIILKCPYRCKCLQTLIRLKNMICLSNRPISILTRSRNSSRTKMLSMDYLARRKRLVKEDNRLIAIRQRYWRNRNPIKSLWQVSLISRSQPWMNWITRICFQICNLQLKKRILFESNPGNTIRCTKIRVTVLLELFLNKT